MTTTPTNAELIAETDARWEQERDTLTDLPVHNLTDLALAKHLVDRLAAKAPPTSDETGRLIAEATERYTEARSYARQQFVIGDPTGQMLLRLANTVENLADALAATPRQLSDADVERAARAHDEPLGLTHIWLSYDAEPLVMKLWHGKKMAAMRAALTALTAGDGQAKAEGEGG